MEFQKFIGQRDFVIERELVQPFVLLILLSGAIHFHYKGRDEVKWFFWAVKISVPYEECGNAKLISVIEISEGILSFTNKWVLQVGVRLTQPMFNQSYIWLGWSIWQQWGPQFQSCADELPALVSNWILDFYSFGKQFGKGNSSHSSHLVSG